MPERLRGRTLARLRLFVDAYGMRGRERERVVDAMVDAHDWCYRVVRAAVAAGHEPFGRMWHAGGARRAPDARGTGSPPTATRCGAGARRRCATTPV